MRQPSVRDVLDAPLSPPDADLRQALDTLIDRLPLAQQRSLYNLVRQSLQPRPPLLFPFWASLVLLFFV
jgi:hypothetical protein